MLTRLVVLGMLLQRAMTGYEMQRLMQLNRMDQWAGILPGSIYHALKKLEHEGLIALESLAQAGNRTKAIYAITPAGATEFRRLLREAWRAPTLHFPAGVYAACNFLDDLPREDVLRALDEQIAALQAALDTWNVGEAIKADMAPSALLDYLRAIFANGREHIELDLRFLRQLRAIIPAIPHIDMTIPPLEETE